MIYEDKTEGAAKPTFVLLTLVILLYVCLMLSLPISVRASAFGGDVPYLFGFFPFDFWPALGCFDGFALSLFELVGLFLFFEFSLIGEPF